MYARIRLLWSLLLSTIATAQRVWLRKLVYRERHDTRAPFCASRLETWSVVSDEYHHPPPWLLDTMMQQNVAGSPIAPASTSSTDTSRAPCAVSSELIWLAVTP